MKERIGLRRITMASNILWAIGMDHMAVLSMTMGGTTAKIGTTTTTFTNIQT
jgi:hypothetical protein